MKLEKLVGEHILQGIELGSMQMDSHFSLVDKANYIKFRIDGTTYLALEDPDDGWRSYMAELKAVDEGCEVRLPDIRVLCKMRKDDGFFGENNVLEFWDVKSGECILAVGTEDVGTWYPCCILEYHPENMACNKEAEE